VKPGDLAFEGRRVAFWTAGSGTPVVLVHGSLATSATWRRTAASLDGAGLCLIAPDLPGWGESEPEPADCADLLDYETRAIEAIARVQSQPVHLVAHSYGCNVALLAALAGRITVRSLVLFEPTLVALLRQSGDVEAYGEIERFVDGYRRAHDAGDRRAVGTVIDLWGGPGSFDAMPENARNAIAAWVPRNLRHWTPAFRPSAAFERLQSIRLPTTLVVSERAHPAARLIAQRMQERLAQCRIAEIAGANHFMIFTHPAETARIIRENCHGS
jgi:pimeloyl-ACP methyl ester carboxylesterase